MLELFTSPWIPLMVLVALAVFARFSRGSWLAPSAFGPLVWSVFISIPLLIASEYQVSAVAVWVIVLLIFSIQIGAIVGEQERAGVAEEIESEPFPVARLVGFTVFFAILGTIGALYYARFGLAESGLPFSLEGFLSLGHVRSVARYMGEQPPIGVRALVAWVYPAALLGGVGHVLAETRLQRLLSFAAFLPALLFATIEAARAGSLIAICCWLAGFLATKSYTSAGRYRMFNRRALVSASAVIIVAVCFFAVLDAVRTHHYDTSFEVAPDWLRVKGSMLGYLSVFSHWITSGDSTPLGLGAYTFAGPFKATGLHAKQLGLYDSAVTLSGGAETNIYTAFRGLIQDFSLPGAVVACFLVGLLSGRAYWHSVQGDRGWFLVLAAYYAFLLWSPIVCLFIYNGLILAWVAGHTVLKGLSGRNQVLNSRAKISTLHSGTI